MSNSHHHNRIVDIILFLGHIWIRPTLMILGGKSPFFQGNLGWLNIMIWPE